MHQPDYLFSNLFDDRNRITPDRLITFAGDALVRMKPEDTEGKLAPDADSVKAALETLSREHGEVDTTLNVQKGATTSVNAVMDAFVANMRENEGVIAKALGGKGSAGYLEFYPHGTNEYTRMTKAEASTFIGRVATAATKWSTTLGSAMKDELSAHKTAWDKARDEQGSHKGEVSGNRGERNDAFSTLGIALTKLVHAVGYHWPGDVAKCSRFFNFSLLDAARHKSLERPQAGDAESPQ